MSTKYFKFQVHGVVQGVNFRAWTKQVANRIAVTGWIKNEDAGHVAGEALGLSQSMDDFKTMLHQGPKYAEVSNVVIEDEKVVDSPDEIGWKYQTFKVKR
ncbi:Acylphosphatase [Serendipita vermifera]|nr:Acylphosphatase [Serendipita vermifera]